MKIFTRVVLGPGLEVLEADFFEYLGPVATCTGAEEAPAVAEAGKAAGEGGKGAAEAGAAAGAGDAAALGAAALPEVLGAESVGTTALAGETIAPAAVEGIAPGALTTEASAALPSVGAGGLDIAGGGLAPPMGDMAAFDPIGMGGDAVPPTAAPAGSNAQLDAAITSAEAPAGGGTRSIGQKLLDSITGNPLTAGALALNAGSAVAQNRNARGIPGQLRDVAKPFSTTGQSLLDQYKTGKLNPGDEFDINRWQHEREAQIRGEFARRNMSGSSAEHAAIARAQEQAQGMRDKARQALLSQGLNAMGMATGPLTAAISAQAQQDQGLMQAQSSALNSLLLLQALQSRGGVPA